MFNIPNIQAATKHACESFHSAPSSLECYCAQINMYTQITQVSRVTPNKRAGGGAVRPTVRCSGSPSTTTTLFDKPSALSEHGGATVLCHRVGLQNQPTGGPLTAVPLTTHMTQKAAHRHRHAHCTQRKRPRVRQYVNIARIESKRGVGRAPRAIAIAVAATGQSAVGRAAREQRVH